MARWATTIDIAGVSFSGCRGEIQTPGKFKSNYRGSVEWGNDGTVDVQVVNTGKRGISFGIQMVSAQNSKLADLFTAVQTAEAALSDFRVNLVDELYTIDVFACPDYGREDWLTHGQPAEGFTPNVIIWFISKGPYM